MDKITAPFLQPFVSDRFLRTINQKFYGISANVNWLGRLHLSFYEKEINGPFTLLSKLP